MLYITRTAFFRCIRCTTFMDMFMFFAHVDFQHMHESVEIVNSRLVSLTLTFVFPTNTDDVSDVK